MRLLLHAAACSALFLAACFSPGDGVQPPHEQLYFPTGLALDDLAVDDSGAAAPAHVYVASSDFDLQYNASALASLDLEKIHHVSESASRDGELVPRSCNVDGDCAAPYPQCDNVETATHVASFFCIADRAAPNPCPISGERSAADKLLYPGRCAPIGVDQLLTRVRGIPVTVGIGAFATDVIYRTNPTSGKGRLFLPVRGDATLHWIDVDDAGALHCGQELTPDDSCDDGHRAGKKASESPQRLRMLPEPFGIDTTADASEIVVTNQTSGALSLFENPWSDKGASVTLSDQLGGLPLAPVTVAALPKPAGGQNPGFLVGYTDAAQIDLVRVDPNAQGFPLIYYSSTTAITPNSIGSDSRDIVVDASVSPARVFVANRAPPSLLVGRLRPSIGRPDQSTDDLPAFSDSVPLSAGPSRVVLGHVRTPNGGSELRVFVVCFDSRQIFIYDPERRQVEAQVRTGRGPYALAVDDARGLAYIGHFTDSFLGVISLDQRFPDTYATIVATIGVPIPPRASK